MTRIPPRWLTWLLALPRVLSLATRPWRTAGRQRRSVAASEAASGRRRGQAAAPMSYKNLFEILRDGGPMMFPLFVCSFITLVFVFERAISLRRGRVIPRPFVKRFLHQVREGKLDRDGALELCHENGSPMAEVFAAAVQEVGPPVGRNRANDHRRRRPRLGPACDVTCGCSTPWPRSAR